MRKSISEESRAKKPFILSPEASSGLKTTAGVVASAWLLKRYPKVAIFGLIGVGVILGLTLKEVARSVDAFPRSRDHLH